MMSPTQAMTVVKDNGYSLILKDGDFHIDPPDGLEKIAQVVQSLKDEMLLVLALMDSVIEWADNDSKKWGMLRKLAKVDLESTFAIEPRLQAKVNWVFVRSPTCTGVWLHRRSVKMSNILFPTSSLPFPVMCAQSMYRGLSTSLKTSLIS